MRNIFAKEYFQKYIETKFCNHAKKKSKHNILKYRSKLLQSLIGLTIISKVKLKGRGETEISLQNSLLNENDR